MTRMALRRIHYCFFCYTFIFLVMVLVESRSSVHNVGNERHRIRYHPSTSSQDALNSHQNQRLFSKRHINHRRRGQTTDGHHQPNAEVRPSSKSNNRRQHRHTSGVPFHEGMLHNALQTLSGSHIFHQRGNPSRRSMYQHHGNTEWWMTRMRTQIEDHIDSLTNQFFSQHNARNLHHRSHHSPSKNHHLVHLHNINKSPSTSHHSFSLPSAGNLATGTQRKLSNNQHGLHQFRMSRHSFNVGEDIPDDVEIFHPSRVPSPPTRPVPPTFSTDAVENPFYFDNCTKVNNAPFHHSVFKSTTISHGRENFNPFNSLGHQITSLVTSRHKSPFVTSQSIHSARRHHTTPRKPNHVIKQIPKYQIHRFPDLSKDPFRELPDSVMNGLSNPSEEISPSAKSSHRITKPSVEEHLSHLKPNNPATWKDQRNREDIPCIKCPPDTHVEAPRGSDCVLSYPPSPLFCTSRTLPEVKTVVTEGPAPGTVLPEGHYQMVITILTSDSSTTTPITTCKIDYDVQVRKCPEHPDVEGAEVTCTAGRAWGSQCSWTCKEELILRGSSVTTCSGHNHLRWTHPPPVCVERPSERTTSPRPKPKSTSEGGGMCYPPPKVPGGHFICHNPSQEFPLRELIPKDDPNVSPGDIRPLSDALTLSLHPVGTVCKVECANGRTLRQSERGRASITCTPTLTWNQRPPLCHAKVSPKIREGDCEDVSESVPLTLPYISSLPLPTFLTADGGDADVTCALQEIISGQQYVRNCKAFDRELQTTASCKYTITSEPTDKCPDLAAPDEGDLICREDALGDVLCEIICNEGHEAPFAFTRCSKGSLLWDFQGHGGESLPPCIKMGTRERPDAHIPDAAKDDAVVVSAKSPKNTRFKTVADVFRDKDKRPFYPNKKYPDEGQTSPNMNKYPGNGNAINHNDDTNEIPYELERETENGNDDDFVYYYDALEDSEDDQDYSDEGTDVEDISHHGILSSALTAVSNVIRGNGVKSTKRTPEAVSSVNGSTENHSFDSSEGEGRIIDSSRSSVTPYSKTHTTGSTQGHLDLMGKHAEFEKKSSEGELAVMEAVLELDMIVERCSSSRQAVEILAKKMMEQKECQNITCHVPETTCHNEVGSDGLVKIYWVVGGSYQPLEDYDDDDNDLQVPMVETIIEDLVKSTERLIATEELTRSLEDHEAAVDLTSFTLTHLDLLCKNPSKTFDPDTNLCRKKRHW